jgi:hypothetical protein
VSTEPRIIDGLKVIELEPGAEAPAGVPPWAQRCDLVKTPNRSPSARKWMIGGGAVGAAVSLAALGFAHGLDDLPGAALIVSLIVLLDGLWPGSQTVVTPSESGRFLAFADGLPQPRSDREESVGCMASGIGVLTMLAAISALVEGDLGTAAFLGLAGWWFYRLGRTGEMEAPDVPPASPEFLALADPNTPLPASDTPTSLPEAAATPPGSQPRGDS